MKASKSGNITEVKKLVTKNSINKISRFGWTVLMFAAHEGHKEVVEILLEKGANPNIVSESIPAAFETTADTPPTTALAEAIRHAHFDIARILMDHDTNIDRDAIALAGGYGDIDLVKTMIAKGVDIDISSNSSFWPSALYMAAENGKLEMVKFLIKNKADPNKIHLKRYIALYPAVEKCQNDIVEHLLKNKADPNIKVSNISVLDRAVHFACRWNKDHSKQYEIIKLLLKNGADIAFKANEWSNTIYDELKSMYNRYKKDPTTSKDSLEKYFTIIKIFEQYSNPSTK